MNRLKVFLKKCLKRSPRLFRHIENVYELLHEYIFLRIFKIPKLLLNSQANIKRYFAEKRNYDPSKLRIAVINHHSAVNHQNHAKPLVDKLSGVDVEYVYSYKPDVIFCYVFGKKRNISKHKEALKVFFTGEAAVRKSIYRKYDGYHLRGNGYDISTGFKFETEHTAANYMRLPLGVLYYFRRDFSREQIAEKIKQIEESARLNGINRGKFCTLINSHDRFKTREKIYQAVSQIDKIDCPGILYHNDNSLKTLFEDKKIDYMRQYRFNICAENLITEGYCTEKIFDALYAGCIPIYTGGDNVDPEPGVLNPEKIIFFNPLEIDESVIIQIKELYRSEKAYKAWREKSIFCDTATEVIHTMFTRYNEMLAELATVLEEKVKKRVTLS